MDLDRLLDSISRWELDCLQAYERLLLDRCARATHFALDE